LSIEICFETRGQVWVTYRLNSSYVWIALRLVLRRRPKEKSDKTVNKTKGKGMGNELSSESEQLVRTFADIEPLVREQIQFRFNYRLIH